jgi:hypothetical protein
LGLDPTQAYALYEVRGVDEPDFEALIAGQKPFELREIATESGAGTVKGMLQFNKRGEYVLAPKGQEKKVFFGKP